MKTSIVGGFWNRLPDRWRPVLLTLITVAAAALATAVLLSQFNVNAILYKGF